MDKCEYMECRARWKDEWLNESLERERELNIIKETMTGRVERNIDYNTIEE